MPCTTIRNIEDMGIFSKIVSNQFYARKTVIFNRILGDGNFVGQVLASAEEAMERRYALRSKGIDLDRLTIKVSKIFGIKAEEMRLSGRFRKIVEARSVLCYWAVREMGVSMTILSSKMGISVAAISGSVIRGQKIVEERGLKII